MPMVPNEELSEEQLDDLAHTLIECKAAKQVHRLHIQACKDSAMDSLLILLIEWSDDCNPLHSIRQNKFSVWVKTITLLTQFHSMSNPDNTFIVGMGPKGVSHQIIERIMKEDLDKLRTGETKLYWKVAGGMVHVRVEVLAVLQDGPERASSTGISGGHSDFGALWGCSANLSAISAVLPCCDACSRALLRNSPEDREAIRECKICVAWDLVCGKDILAFDPPPHFPKSELKRSDKKLMPQYLEFKDCSMADHRAFSRLSRGEWDAETANAYLRVYLRNDNRKELVLACAKRARALDDAIEKHKDRLVAKLTALKQNDPVAFARPPDLSLVSRGTLLSQHIGVIMHLIGLGVIKTTTILIFDWLALRNKKSEFLNLVQGLLDPIRKLQLDWCEIEELKQGTLAGWISKTHFAAARLMPWIFSKIRLIAPDVEPFEPRHDDVGKWTVEECKHWLRLRGLGLSGRVADLRERVNSNPHAPILPPVGGSVSLVEDVIIALVAMVSRIMYGGTCNETRILDVVRHVKMFLNAFDKIDKEMRPAREKLRERKGKRKVKARACGRKPKAQRIIVAPSSSQSHTHSSDSDDEVEVELMEDLESMPDDEASRERETDKEAASQGAASTDSKPGWLSSYNFIRLLNVGRDMGEYGNFGRTLWEGGMLGEGFLRIIKPLFEGGRTGPHFALHVMNEFYRRRSLSAVMRTIPGFPHESAHPRRRKDRKVYKTEEHVRALMFEHDSLSVVILEEGNVAVEIGSADDPHKNQFLHLAKRDFVSAEIGLDYFNWSAQHTSKEERVIATGQLLQLLCERIAHASDTC